MTLIPITNNCQEIRRTYREEINGKDRLWQTSYSLRDGLSSRDVHMKNALILLIEETFVNDILGLRSVTLHARFACQ